MTDCDFLMEADENQISLASRVDLTVIFSATVLMTTGQNVTDYYGNMTDMMATGTATVTMAPDTTTSTTTEFILTTTEDFITTTEIIPEPKYFCGAADDCPSCSILLSTGGGKWSGQFHHSST